MHDSRRRPAERDAIKPVQVPMVAQSMGLRQRSQHNMNLPLVNAAHNLLHFLFVFYMLSHIFSFQAQPHQWDAYDIHDLSDTAFPFVHDQTFMLKR
ncbi:MAG: hypothetical protein JJU36_00920 [Phycisphaeraceae bacterium]|nr:hypothetical protein [Phycisphaeraceae bacterium]